MDLQDDDKSSQLNEHPRLTSRYYETNAGHLFINNINPFENGAHYRGDVKENYDNAQNNEEFVDLYNRLLPNEPSNSRSKALLNEIMRNYPYERDLLINEPCDEAYDALHDAYVANQNPLVQNNRPCSQPSLSLSRDQYDVQFITPCSNDGRSSRKTTRYDPKVRFGEFDEGNNKHSVLDSNEALFDPNLDKTIRAEKTTHCHPLLNMYNQDFVYKTMQRNVRLRRIVRKLVIAREKEKQREAWNNYINDLKNKHRYYSNAPSRISPQYVPDEHYASDGLVDDFYYTKYNWRQSNPCQNLLKEFYGAHNNMPPNAYSRYLHDYDLRRLLDDRTSLYENNSFCYPTSSQANILIRDIDRRQHNYAQDWRRPLGKYFRGNTIIAEKEGFNTFDIIKGTNKRNLKSTIPSSKCKCKNKMCTLFRSSSKPLQTEKFSSLALVNEEDDKYESGLRESENIETSKNDKVKDNEVTSKETFRDKFRAVTNNIARLKDKIRRTEEQYEAKNQEQYKAYTGNPFEDDGKIKSLANIEEKIDGLIKSINSIMVDIKSKRNLSKCASVSCRFISTSHNNLNRPKSETHSLVKNDELVCGVVQTSARNISQTKIGPSTWTEHRETNISKMDTILLEEMNKSNQVKKDIEEILQLRDDRACSVQITFDFPTKERSTEVTDSLSKARLQSGTDVVIEEIPSETITQTQMTIAVNTDPLGLLALLRISTQTVKQLLSFVPNLNYNSYLPMLQLPSKDIVTHYICNICGAAFGRASQLSDHIEQHNLGRTRDCCVCRHMLDMRKNEIGLFSCRYCGQKFTRAYCCELHQQSCAKRLGRCHDVNSSHMLLS